jgi:cobalt-zinc-cadmium efflux system protein
MAGAHDHDHDDDHDHHNEGIGHGHVHAPHDFGVAFAVGTALNLGFVVLEATYGFIANSMALLADAGHNLSDVFGLLMAWGASILVKRAPTERFTYGFGSSSILAALANAIFLLVAIGAIAWEAVQRLSVPEPVASQTIIWVAAAGIIVNGVTAWLFASGSKGDINIRGAFLLMAADAAISLGVVVAGIIMLETGWLRLDPIVSIAIAAVIIYGTWGLLRESTGLAMHAVPPGIDPTRVQDHLEKLPGVAQVHDLHIWPVSTTETALTCHLVMPDGHPGDAFLADAAKALQTAFAIRHATFQIEHCECAGCPLTGKATR